MDTTATKKAKGRAQDEIGGFTLDGAEPDTVDIGTDAGGGHGGITATVQTRTCQRFL